jgi:hypothetical protein
MSFILARIFGNKYAVLGIGLAVGLSAALTWHYVDKAAAVRSAQQELADKVTIETQRAQLAELARRAAIAEEARTTLEIKVALAEDNASRAAQELDEYAQNNEVNSACVVDDVIAERLHNF